MLAPSRFETGKDLSEKLLRDLGYRLGTPDLCTWIEERTLILARLGWQGVAGFVDLTPKLLAQLRVKSIVDVQDASELRALAQLRLLPNGDGYEILCRRLWKTQPEADRRFWIAHELAHTFWLAADGSGRPLSPFQRPLGTDPTIEWLCNRASAALLLPRSVLELSLRYSKRTVDGWPIPLRLLPYLAVRLRLPIQMVARRWLHDVMRWNVAVVCLERCPRRKASDGAWRIRWDAIPRPGFWRSKRLYRRLVPLRFLPSSCGDKSRTGIQREVELPGQWRGLLQQGEHSKLARSLSSQPKAPPLQALCAHVGDVCYLAISLPNAM